MAVEAPSLADQALDSERIVLGSVLLDPTRFSGLGVTGSDFTNQHRNIFECMLSIYLREQTFDSWLVAEELRRRKQLWDGGAFYVSTLTESPNGGPIMRHVALDGHCRRIRDAAIRRKLARACKDTLDACYDVGVKPNDLLERHGKAFADIDSDRTKVATNSLALVRGSEVLPETASWLIEPYLPAGQLALLVGDPGSGKTFVSLSLAAGITTGRSPFSAPRTPQNVLYFSNEDSPSVLRRRFDVLGGDPNRIWFESADHAITLSDHTGIEGAIKEHDAMLLVLDTVVTHFGGRVDFHKASEVAALLSPLVAVAARTGASVLGLMHLSKASQSHSLYRVQGSTAFAGAARSILAIGTDPTDPTQRVLAHLKSNGAAVGASRRFTIDHNGVGWGSTTELRAADVLGPETPAAGRSALQSASDFLSEALKHGSRDATELIAEAEKHGIRKRTLERAKSALSIKSRKNAANDGWIWWMPEMSQSVQ